MKLSVKIDHIATLREARKSTEPDPVYGSVLAELAGADSITVHYHQDRRHIQERDIEQLRAIVKTRMILEMGVSMGMVRVALNHKPDMCILVPETTEDTAIGGGLDVVVYNEKVGEVAGNLKAAGIEVGVFIDPSVEQIKSCHRIGIKNVKINTAEYAKNWANSYAIIELEKIQKAVVYAKKLEMKIFAGSGLTFQNVYKIVEIKDIGELIIGHSLISNATFLGLAEAIKRMKSIMHQTYP